MAVVNLLLRLHVRIVLAPLGVSASCQIIRVRGISLAQVIGLVIDSPACIVIVVHRLAAALLVLLDDLVLECLRASIVCHLSGLVVVLPLIGVAVKPTHLLV